MPATAASPWYKHLWPWIIIGILATSVCLSLTMVSIAVHNPDNLVNDNYYEAGKGINRSLDRELLAQYYVIPHWYIGTYRLAYWDKFGQPAIAPQRGDAVDEGIVHPLVGVEEFVACIAHHDFLEAEVGQRVVHDVVDDLLEHVAVLPELCLVELVEVVDDATMLIIDFCNAQVQLGGPFNVRHA